MSHEDMGWAMKAIDQQPSLFVNRQVERTCHPVHSTFDKPLRCGGEQGMRCRGRIIALEKTKVPSALSLMCLGQLTDLC